MIGIPTLHTRKGRRSSRTSGGIGVDDCIARTGRYRARAG
jgi:hypothetical protein